MLQIGPIISIKAPQSFTIRNKLFSFHYYPYLWMWLLILSVWSFLINVQSSFFSFVKSQPGVVLSPSFCLNQWKRRGIMETAEGQHLLYTLYHFILIHESPVLVLSVALAAIARLPSLSLIHRFYIKFLSSFLVWFNIHCLWVLNLICLHPVIPWFFRP